MDQLFLQFVRGLFIIMTLFGAGMLIVVLFGDHNLGLRMLNIFASMFVGVLGLGSGYILGKADQRRVTETRKEDPNGKP